MYKVTRTNEEGKVSSYGLFTNYVYCQALLLDFMASDNELCHRDIIEVTRNSYSCIDKILGKITYKIEEIIDEEKSEAKELPES